MDRVDPPRERPQRIRVRRRGELVGPVESAHIVKSDAEWREQLTLPQFRIARGKDTAKHPFASNAEAKHGDSVGKAGGRQMQGAHM